MSSMGYSKMTAEQSKAFGAEMKRLRKDAGLTISEFAKYLEVSASYVCSLEQARKKPSPTLAEKIAGVFNTTVDSMLAPADSRVDEFRKKYGAALREHREKKGLPCAVVAGALGIPPYVYKEYEQGLCSVTEREIDILNRLLDIGKKPEVVERQVVVEVPADIPTEICDMILGHVKDLQVGMDEQKQVWRYFSRAKLNAEEKKLFSTKGE